MASAGYLAVAAFIWVGTFAIVCAEHRRVTSGRPYSRKRFRVMMTLMSFNILVFVVLIVLFLFASDVVVVSA